MTGDFQIAIHSLVYLYQHEKELISSDKLAEILSTHPVRIRRIMLSLKKAGIVYGRAGINGGYIIERDKKDVVTLADIGKTIQEVFVPEQWLNGKKETDLQYQLKDELNKITAELNDMMEDTFSKVKLKDLAQSMKKGED